MKNKRAVVKCKKLITTYKMGNKTIYKSSVEALAKQIIQQYNVKNYPVPVVSMLTDLGFTVCTNNIFSMILAENEYPNIVGFVAINPEYKYKYLTDKIIAVRNQNMSIGKQRYIIAYLFAEYLFEFKEDTALEFFDICIEDKIDMLLNSFVLEILLPQNIFIKRCKELKEYTNYEKIRQLSEDFRVTPLLVRQRIEGLYMLL